MTTIQRTRLDVCGTKGCPFDDDAHIPWCRNIPGVYHSPVATHQHWPKRSRGGKKIVAILCSLCHDRTDNTPFWENTVLSFDDGERRYRLTDSKTGQILIDRQLGAASDGGERDPMPRAQGAVLPPSPAPSVEAVAGIAGRAERLLDLPPPLGGSVDGYVLRDNGIDWEPEFTFKDWVTAAQKVQTESTGRQWRVGDLVRAEHWAECSQYIDEIDYPVETQANYGRVAEAYKLAERRSLSFGHHTAVYKHPDRLSLLDAALANGWTRRELREAAYPDTAKRVKRFTVEALRERLAEWPGERALRNNGRKFAEAWLNWLEGSEAC